MEVGKLNMLDVNNYYLACQGIFSPLDLVKRAGEIFVASQGVGRNGRNFFFHLLAGYLGWADSDTGKYLAIMAMGAKDKKDQEARVLEAVEIAFAHLDCYLEKQPREILMVLAVIRNNPPDAGFLDRVAGRIAAIKAEGDKAA